MLILYEYSHGESDLCSSQTGTFFFKPEGRVREETMLISGRRGFRSPICWLSEQLWEAPQSMSFFLLKIMESTSTPLRKQQFKDRTQSP